MMSTCLRQLAVALLLAGMWGTAAVSGVGAAVEIEVGGVAVVATTEGDVLALRSGPGVGYPALTAFAAGTELRVLEGPVTGADGLLWYRVAAGGLAGWCAATWLAPPAGASGTRYIGGSDGGANLRDEPTLAGEIIRVIPEGGAVVLLGADSYADGIGWTLARYGGVTGWVATAFLGGVSAGSGGQPAAGAATAPAVPQGRFDLVVGENALVIGTDGFDLRIRDGIGTGAPIFATVPANTVITIVNGPLADEAGAAWYGVGYDGLYGWVLGEHLAPTTAPPGRRFDPSGGAVAAFATTPAPPNPARGRAIVAEALQHLGVPYVWGGDGPAGWDCSGMIQWLYWKVTGAELPRVSQDQFHYGTPLRPDEVEAGDLVFFFDTDGPGITHNGIALGDGRFIHARSEALGTVISRLDEPYWVAHYAGARRP